MDSAIGENLIKELTSDPVEFSKKGKGYKLLQAYFHGFPLDTLRVLLSHKNRTIQREAVAIVSELGRQGSSLIFDIIPFLNDQERAIRYDALESVMVFSEGENADEFRHVVMSMEADDPIIRIRSMYLVSNANDAQLRAAVKQAENGQNLRAHKEGLSFLQGSEAMEPKQVREFLFSSNSLARKYGAIAAKRMFQSCPELIREAVNNADPDIKQFAEDVIEMEDG